MYYRVFFLLKAKTQRIMIGGTLNLKKNLGGIFSDRDPGFPVSF